MRVRVRRSDDVDMREFAVFETDAPPRKGDQLRFNDDGEAFFEVEHIIYDLERFKQPEIIVVVSPTHVLRFEFLIVWKDAAERPSWLPEDFHIECNILPRAGELIMIAFADPDSPNFVDVEIVAIEHGSLYQPSEDDRKYGLGFGDLETVICVRKVERGEHGDYERIIARVRRN